MKDDPALRRLDEKIFEELRKSPTRIRFRVKNSRVDYSIMNRPDPDVTPVTDEWLAPAFVHAGSHFTKARVTRKSAREAVHRIDGRSIKYKDEIVVDWTKEEIRSTAAEQLTLQVLSIVVSDLMREAYRKAPPPSAPN
jgi:hypothetical protein